MVLENRRGIYFGPTERVRLFLSLKPFIFILSLYPPNFKLISKLTRYWIISNRPVSNAPTTKTSLNSFVRPPFRSLALFPSLYFPPLYSLSLIDWMDGLIGWDKVEVCTPQREKYRKTEEVHNLEDYYHGSAQYKEVGLELWNGIKPPADKVTSLPSKSSFASGIVTQTSQCVKRSFVNLRRNPRPLVARILRVFPSSPSPLCFPFLSYSPLRFV